MSSPLAAVFAGSDTLLLQCLEIWRERGHRVVAVATDTDKIRRACLEQGLRVVDATGDLAALLAGEAFDHLFAITWLRLLPEAVLALPRRSTLNFHDGPLPRYAGLNATCWALLHGETEHAVTWHVVEPRADTGEILLQRTFAVAADDTAFTLNARCFQVGQETFAELVDGLAAGTVAGRAQDLTRRSYFGRTARPPALALLDFGGEAAAAARLVRAFDHGGYRNPIAIAKVRAPHGVFVPAAVQVVAGNGAAPGTVTEVGDDFVQIACRDGEVRLLRPHCLRHGPLDRAALAAYGVTVGARLPAADAAVQAALTELGRTAAADEDAWVATLRLQQPLPVPDGSPAVAGAAVAVLPLGGTPGEDPFVAAARCATFLARVTAVPEFTLGLHTRDDLPTDLAVACPPVNLGFDAARAVGATLQTTADTLRQAARRGPLLRELLVRRADVLPPTTPLESPVRLCVGVAPVVAPGTLAFAVAADGRVALHYDRNTLAEAQAQALAARWQVFARASRAQPDVPVARVPILDEAELQRLLHAWNETAAPLPAEPCVHRQFAVQAARTPDHVALRFQGEALTYRELVQRVERLAGWLRGRGVAPGDRVGICTQRGIGMVVAVLATMRCGACYVPLDPTYPRERLQFMAGDAELAALVVDTKSLAAAPTAACPRVDLDADAAAIEGADVLLDDPAKGDDLAYMIYTSGSTGQPKGVMVRHRNATNFFLGMDRVLGTEPGVWLAVTSLSFDISVLELLWTLARGFTVVVQPGEGSQAQKAQAAAPVQARPISFSLFYFASDEGELASDKYRLLLEGARFADRNGFEAVWTPERHFHAFGGLYPNPAVASAGLATITENVHIRAGSCVLPLHHPIRIAEEWSLVDNLSNGRVGIAFAAGWHGRDFVLRPETFADRKQVLFTGLRQVQALWRGETVEFPGHDGKPVPIKTLPRPVQKELPTWVTVAGNPETYRAAGESGSYVLTHLLGQSTEELAQKIGVYRQAWRAAGHTGEGRVTLMLHTFVGDDEESVRNTVREPMKGYLRSSLDLVKQAAWSFPAFKNRVDKPGELDALLQGGLTPADFEALLEFSFERYYRQSGLFGTPESCQQIVDKLRGMHIDEIACLVDFGVPTDLVMAHLPQLNELKRRCDAATAAARATGQAAATTVAPVSIPQAMREHGVTHFQCTPSMAGMLLLDPDAAPALRGLRHMLVGGEALAVRLGRDLTALVPNLHDVYGPTETTVWSTTSKVGSDEPIPIGRPLANQRVYVLDRNLQPVPTGAPGELWIGGAGVTAGYHRRPELTAERFVPDPFVGGDARIYGTGDLVRWRPDGVLEYLGRKDHQVKVRGYRIELGEIEAALSRHAGVREVVVVARDDGGETRLCAYLVPRSPAPTVEDLRTHLRGSLPEFMVPSHFVTMADLPRTPNLKVDRKQLPSPEQATQAGKKAVVQAQDATEDAILAIWKQALGTEDVGVEDNFFDSGGHSILAVRVHREIVQRLGVELQVTDLFRFTTVRALARHLQVGKSVPTAAQQAMERAKQRRNLLRRP